MKDNVLARSHPPPNPVPSIKCLHFFFDVRELLTQRRHRFEVSDAGCVCRLYVVMYIERETIYLTVLHWF